MPERVKYYDAHCSGCGEVTTADLLAFDFGRLIQIAVQKAYDRDFGSDDKWLPLLQVDPAIYLTWRDLSQMFHLENGKYSNFKFTVGDLKNHIEHLTKIDFEEIENANGINNLVYNTLTRKIKTPLQAGKKATYQDIDKTEHAERIQTIVNLCSKSQSVDSDVIVQFQVRVNMANDDNGNPFPKSLNVIFEDDDNQSVINNVCPYCGKRFYSEVGKYEEIIICMAGSARVGKTAYLAALVDCLQKRNDFADVLPSSDAEWRFFNDKILEAYQKGEKIDKTAFEGNDETIPLFSLEIRISTGKHYIFTFIDMPGEAFDDGKGGNAGISFINNSRKIVQYAQMIWFCVDPQQVNAEVAAIAGITTQDQDRVNTKTFEVMANIGNTLRHVYPDGKKNAAVLITKSDMILSDGGERNELFQPDTKVLEEYMMNESGYGLSVKFEPTMQFAASTREYLNTANKFETNIAAMFEHYNMFSVAAYGQDLPDMDMYGLSGETSNFQATPSMIELPFIWTLAALGKTPALKMVPKYELKGFGPFKKEVYIGDFPEPVLREELYLK